MAFWAVQSQQANHSDPLTQANEFRRQRRFADAEGLYRAVLRDEPANSSALGALGGLYRQMRRLEEGAAVLERAVAIDPSNTRTLSELGMTLAELGRAEAALTYYNRAIALKPDFFEAHNNLAIALLTLGRVEPAIARFEAVLALRPGSVEVLNNLGNALAMAGRHEEALTCFRDALNSRPGFALGHHNMAVALTALGRPEQAIEHYERVIALQPSDRDAHIRLGNVRMMLRQFEAALAQFELAAAIEPPSAAALAGLGTALAQLDRHDEAIGHFERAIALAPGLAELRNNIANSLTAVDRHEEAVDHFRRALELKPDFVTPHANLGNALEALGRMDEALNSYETALAANPDLPEVHHNKGNVLRVLGRMRESRRAFERAIELAPDKPLYYRGLSDSMSFTSADFALVEATEKLVEKYETLPDQDRVELHFALAKAYDDLGRYEEAFAQLLDGNRLVRRQVEYDEAATIDVFRRSVAVFTTELLKEKSGFGDPSAVPIFIVGMPRSGTTLVEQVLASHTAVYGAGELPDFSRLAAPICEPSGAKIPFPESIRSIPAVDLELLGTTYLSGVVTKAPSAARITDKMPSNFRLVGLIRLALPNSKIIHVRRDPVDTCLSCFSKLFRRTQTFTYDLRELGRYYRAYEGLMAHWRRVLPAGVMLEVRYEELIADFEPQARRIAAHCGLDWEPGCLAFHKTERPVRTASALQVRQPLYRNAVGRWKPYEPWLGPLLEELGLDFATG